MARINNQTKYPLDTLISNNDFLIGSDGDNTDVTKTFSLLGILNYIKSKIIQDIVIQDGGWIIEGNNNINDTINFIGTINPQDLVFKVNNVEVARFNYDTQIFDILKANIDSELILKVNVSSFTQNNTIRNDGVSLIYKDNLGIENELLTNNTGWGLSGNTGTNATTNFIGTTDPQDFVIRANNVNRAIFRTTGIHQIGTNAIADNGIVLNGYGTGNRGSTLQFASSGTPLSVVNAEIARGSGSNGEFRLINYGNNILSLSTNGDNRRLIITSTGNVGINTLIPTKLLDVAGEVRIRTLPLGLNTDDVLVADVNGNLRKIASTNVIQNLQQVTDVGSATTNLVSSTTGFSVNRTNTGNGINSIITDGSALRGATEYGRVLELILSGGAFADYIWAGFNGSTLILNNAGNLGINTNTPTKKLDVNGEARIRTIPSGSASNDLIVTDVDGNLTKITQSEFKNANPQFGVWNYNNSLANQAITATTWTKVNNNGGGANTYLGGALVGVDIYNTTTYQFDYTDLTLYDSIDVRFDANVTTTSANQEVRVRLLLSVGSLNIPLTFIDSVFKTAGTYAVVGLIQNHIFTENVRTNPAQLEVWSDAACTLATNGWAIKVNKRV